MQLLVLPYRLLQLLSRKANVAVQNGLRSADPLLPVTPCGIRDTPSFFVCVENGDNVDMVYLDFAKVKSSWDQWEDLEHIVQLSVTSLYQMLLAHDSLPQPWYA